MNHTRSMTAKTPDVVAGTVIYPHHSPSSGYGQLAKVLPATNLQSTDSLLGQAPEGTLRWNIGRKVFDFRILLRALTADVLHLLYIENHLRLLTVTAKRCNRKLKTVGTVHLPLDYYSTTKSVAALRELHGVITLTRNQADEVREHLPDHPVRFIPHGIAYADERYLESAIHEDPEFSIVVVGSNYRDWETLSAVIDYAKNRDNPWKFHLVGLPAGRRAQFEQVGHTTVHPRLEESHYYDLLNRSHVLFLPVTFATANNALLEAHSVGCPSVCSELPGIKDYAVSTTRLFTGTGQAIDALENLSAQDKQTLTAERKQTREAGRRYSWENIAGEVMAFYRELLDVDSTADG